VPAISGIVDAATAYASINGKFPSSGQLSLKGTHGASTSVYVGGSFISPFINYINVDDWDSWNGGVACGRRGYVSGQISSGSLASAPSIAGSPAAIGFTCIMANINSTFQSKCFYEYGLHPGYDSNYNYITDPSGIENIIPGWINANTTTAGDANNLNSWAAYVQANATCL
jgi:hypothetical protein